LFVKEKDTVRSKLHFRVFHKPHAHLHERIGLLITRVIRSQQDAAVYGVDYVETAKLKWSWVEGVRMSNEVQGEGLMQQGKEGEHSTTRGEDVFYVYIYIYIYIYI
jgi:hypothetical protein